MTKLHHHKTAPFTCPACGAVNDAAVGADESGRAPRPGSVMICLECTQAALLTDDIALRLPSLEEMIELLGCPYFVHATVAAKAYRAEHPKVEGTVH